MAAPVADFSALPLSGNAPLEVVFTDLSTESPTSRLWDFGDGNTSTDQNPTHEYETAGEYEVSLTATNIDGSDDEVKTAYIDVDMVADFSATPLTGDANLEVQFTDESLGNPDTRLWDFGDGTTSTDQNPLHEYTEAGVFEVSLTASLGAKTDTETKSTYVNVEMVADFSATPQAGGNPLEVQFTDESLGSPDTRLWDFGDGNTSTAQNPLHEYTDAGSYEVSLTASLGAKTDTKTVSNFIVVAAAAPNAAFSVTPDTGEGPLSVAFTDESEGDPTTRWRDFGDGFFSNVQNPTHVYYKAGVYSPKLTVTNREGRDVVTEADLIEVEETTPGQTNVEFIDEGRRGGRSFPPLREAGPQEDDRAIIPGTKGVAEE